MLTFIARKDSQHPSRCLIRYFHIFWKPLCVAHIDFHAALPSSSPAEWIHRYQIWLIREANPKAMHNPCRTINTKPLWLREKSDAGRGCLPWVWFSYCFHYWWFNNSNQPQDHSNHLLLRMLNATFTPLFGGQHVTYTAKLNSTVGAAGREPVDGTLQHNSLSWGRE